MSNTMLETKLVVAGVFGGLRASGVDVSIAGRPVARIRRPH